MSESGRQWTTPCRAISRIARTQTPTRAAGTAPAGSSTTNDAVPGKRWFCQFDAVPNGHSMLWYG